jgi:hypothetical protein
MKKPFFNFLGIAISFSVLIAGCGKDTALAIKAPEGLSHSVEENSQLRRDFGQAMAKALKNSQELRAFIKTEALTMFDNDYDVLYLMVKDKMVNGQNTFREILIKYFKDEATLDEIESKIPLLTIFVPELPENTFSAKTWDIINEVPVVGVSLQYTNDVAIIDADEISYMLSSDKIPSFPVVVVKENERVRVADKSKEPKHAGRKFTADKQQYEFLDDCFDVTKNKPANTNRVTFSLDQKIIDAYNTYAGTDGWHRDYVYYGITPSNPNGPFTYDYQEHITTFSMNGDPMAAYNKIADQTGDPTINHFGGLIFQGPPPTQITAWTGGAFEFKVKVLFNGKNGVGSEFITYFSALGSDLFVVSYKKVLSFWSLDTVTIKTMNLALPIFNWDLNQYAATVKVDIEEVDLTQTTTITETDNVKFATNFGIEGTTVKKLGLKFGASLEVNQTRTTTKSFVEGNDILGSVLINFADNIILGTEQVNNQTQYITRDYSSGFFKISMEPLRVQ